MDVTVPLDEDEDDRDYTARIEARVCPLVLELMNRAEPRTGLEGKFSFQHCAAAALIDGADWGTILWRVAVPLAAPAIATIAVFNFLAGWEAFIWPMLITGVIQFDAMPTPPASRAVPRNTPVQLKYRLWTNASTSVTSHSTRMNGCLSRPKAVAQADDSRSLESDRATF